ncbi:MAG: alginate lyase family protein [Planctomycetes bacterium]|nr:alginate lyase family protein [Planctomycetota bacterium]
MNRALLYARTIPTLRPTQIIGRLWRVVHKPRIDASPAPRRRADVNWTVGPRRERSLVGRDRVRLLGREREIAGADDWNDARESKLWLYQLHYHDDLVAEDAAERAAWHDRWIGRWIQENPPGEGNGWEPYPLSIRVVRWIQWALTGGRISPEAVHSLAVQTRYLRDSLEHHLLGNHLFANAKAIVFAGLFFEGREADAWLQRGTELVARELREQVLADGGHFERSPMYHCLFLEDLLDLSNLIRGLEHALPARRRGLPDELNETIGRMRRWMRAMLHPDGAIPFFNDAAFGMAPESSELEAYARRLEFGPGIAPGDGVIELAESGYVRLQSGAAFVICDVGELGPRYLLGHAHADTLSFEASFFGERWFVNSGTSLYGESAERVRQRGTAAHNTVEVDGADSSEVWSGFRVARRAKPFDLSITDEARVLTVRCSHDGYERLPGRVRHSREWRLDDGSLSIVDRLAGEYTSARCALHVHPDVRIERAGAELRRGPLAVRLEQTGGRLRCEDGTWHPSFGRTVPNLCLRTTLQSPTLHTRLSW